ncbi:MAG: hypothetical protein PHF64_02855 [Methanoregula sp.]|nr:hypothetical protein [Methanoregula sp.]
MIRIKANKPCISPDVKPVRALRRMHLRPYTSMEIGATAGYILLGMLSAYSSMSGILVGSIIRLLGL